MLDLLSFDLQNPWRKDSFRPQESVPRALFQDILNWLDARDIIVMIGSRQTGKTTLLHQIIAYLLDNNTPAVDIFYFNLDDESLLEFFKTPAEFLNFIELQQKSRAYVFIDEVQRLQNPGLFLKYIHDLRKNIKLIVTGSSSLEIRAKTSESLTGRKQLFWLQSFSFNEFLRAKWPEFPTLHGKLPVTDRDSFFAAVKKIKNIYGSTLDKWLAEYLLFGGYPRVALEPAPQRKIAYLKEILTSYIQKDVKDFLKIENISGYNNLIKILAQQIGSLINISELANTLGMHKVTIKKYLNMLEGTFMFNRLSPYFTNLRRELTKMPKIYSLDSGLRNFAVGNFSDVTLRSDRGELAENFVFTELLRLVEAPVQLHYWRTQTRAEVDFIIEFTNALVPVEVKFKPMTAPQVSRSFRSFISTYQPKNGAVFTKNLLGRKKIGDTEILFLPLWSCLFFQQEFPFISLFHTSS